MRRKLLYSKRVAEYRSPSVQSFLESITSASPLVLTPGQTTSNLEIYSVTAVPEASAFFCVGLVAVAFAGCHAWKNRAK
ncbi:MAG TPA: hypothetical protein VH107_00145 [Lacipirellulaceae bacterium]|nr:hypothetical protein [Lacipirellulaceae bacterium]